MCRVSAIPELVGIVVDLAVVGTPAGNSRDQPFKDRKFMVQIVNFKLKRGGGSVAIANFWREGDPRAI